MEHLSLTTPTLLFSAVSLIMLAYTNRFLAYASLVRDLHQTFMDTGNKLVYSQITNLRKRLKLTRAMQVFGVSSLFLCVLTMFLIYVGNQILAAWIFGVALVLFCGSLATSIIEIQISVKALDLHLSDMEKAKN